MDPKALYNLSYGLYIITSKSGERINGQIANTAFQISNEPPTIAVSINKNNLTNQFIRNSKLFAVSVLAQDAPLSLVGHFGFKSGREVDKFQGVAYQITDSGLPYITEHTLAYIEARVIQEVDAGTHNIFIGEITGAEVLHQGTPMTYAHYQMVKRGGTQPTAPSNTPKPAERTMEMNKYECSVCGYVYDPSKGDPDNGITAGTPFEKLPDDWVCPVCGAGKEEFQKAE